MLTQRADQNNGGSAERGRCGHSIACMLHAGPGSIGASSKRWPHDDAASRCIRQPHEGDQGRGPAGRSIASIVPVTNQAGVIVSCRFLAMRTLFTRSVEQLWITGPCNFLLPPLASASARCLSFQHCGVRRNTTISWSRSGSRFFHYDRMERRRHVTGLYGKIQRLCV